MNKRIIFKLVVLVVLALLITACCATIQGSGNVITEPRQVSSFDRVSFSGSGEVIVTQGQHESLTVEAEDNIMPHITTKVKHRTLVLGFKRGDWWNAIRPTKPIKYNLSVKDIVGFDISGSGSISAASIKSDDMELDVSGSGNVVIGSLTAEILKTRISGSGKCDLSGQVMKQAIDISGSGKYRARKLDSKMVTAEISGSGNVSVWVRDKLDVKISGSAKVNYYGRPSVTMDVSGSGSVRSLGDF